jgi:GTP-binding protein
MADLVRAVRDSAPPPAPDPDRPAPRAPSTRPASRSRREATCTWSAARSPSAGCARPTSANDEAVGYLADRLARLGVEDALREAGAQPGDTVVVGDGDDAVVFDWEPSLTAGAERLAGRAAATRGSRAG